MRKAFVIGSVIVSALILAFSIINSAALWCFVVVGPLLIIGYHDLLQKSHTVRRNFPLIGNFRYLFEAIRPEINQYFVESNTDGVPFSREQRSLVYQRAKGMLDTLPFGTQKDVYQLGYEWLNHSLIPSHVDSKSLRVSIGGPDCKQVYSSSIMNISAMSYGALSKNAVLALNGGAKDGNFAHNTGEGGLSPYHLQNGGDITWQIGTGYFGCRSPDGKFDPQLFKEKARLPQVKMIEIKLSQGAKPGHGGILPAAKVTQEISEIRGVPMGQDVMSPPGHTAFKTPVELLQFIGRLRDLSEGKPIGFKLCLGKRHEFLALCKAMIETGITPDFITVDGGEGGTGAAPLEFSNNVGTPLTEGLIFVHNCLVGYSLRNRIKVIASGKVTSGFDVIKRLALGADVVNSARAFMLALGCIQALRCNNNSCPTGVATQDPSLVAGLWVPSKRKRVHAFHDHTVESVAEILAAMGIESTRDLRPWHLTRRVGVAEVKSYSELYEYLKPGALLQPVLPESYSREAKMADAHSFKDLEF
jgi:glutamate synthase domain-containing protein 2